TLSRSGYITLRVRDDYYEGPELRFIKTEEPMPVGNHVSYWDGRDESGNLLAYGDYLIALWAYTFEDNAILIKGGRPIIENFGITNVRVRPDGSNPYIIGTDYEQANIYFTVSQDANVTINIYNSSAVRAKTLLSDSFLSQGVVHNITWDGLDDSNSRLCEGGYRAVVQARVGQNYSEPVILQIDLDF
ncbi:MAG: hypothetical protein L6416_03460, partial [Candidatus Omnitrophica bacterium]|nr:hypothetical protein [Candidatus Omnitrophota bacterium]